MEKSEVTFAIAAWQWHGGVPDGGADENFLGGDNWFAGGIGWLNAPTFFPVYLGPVVQYVNGLPIAPFIPSASMPTLQSDFTGPRFIVAGSDVPVIFTIEGATYTVEELAEVGSAPHHDYIPTGGPVPGVLRLEGAGVDGLLILGQDAIGQLSVGGQSFVADLHMAGSEEGTALIDIDCGGILDVDELQVGFGNLIFDSCGRFVVPDDGEVTLTGGSQRLGEIVLEADLSAAHLTYNDDVTLVGDAAIVVSAAGAGVPILGIGSFASEVKLRVPSSSTLRIEGGELLLQQRILAVDGTLEVRNDGDLEARFAVIDGSSPAADVAGAAPGRVRILDGAALRLGASGRLRGAVVETVGSGELLGYDGTLEDSILEGRARVGDSQELILAGAVEVNGEIIIDESGELVVAEGLVLGGEGKLRCPGGDGTLNLLDGEPLLLPAPLRLEGGCFIQVPLTVGGVLAPGRGDSAMDVHRDLTFEPGAILEIGLDAAGVDVAEIYGANAVDLGGATLRLLTAPAALETLEASDELVLIDDRSSHVELTGQFANVAPGERLVGANCESFRVDYGPGAPRPDAVVLTDFAVEPGCLLLRDGFESGDVGAWTTSVP